jgi:hypothetical protein
MSEKRVVWKAEGKNILVNPPQNMGLRFSRSEFEAKLKALMEEHGIDKLNASLIISGGSHADK